MAEAKILIADGSEDFIEDLCRHLHKEFTLRTTCDGLQALELLSSFQPDIFVLDLIMPGMDGLSLLAAAQQENLLPPTLASTRFLSEYLTDRVSTLGVEYLVIKPCSITAVAARIRDMASRAGQNTGPALPDPRITVSNVLLQLDFPTKRRGYSFLRDAILLYARDPAQSITKELYPAIAAMYAGTTVSQVEHSIRSVIRSAWERRDAHVWQLYFPATLSDTARCPTNAQFISRIAEPLSRQSFGTQGRE